ncbi:MAG: hypothetical protein JRH20_29405 [Deltaproteobacteria bacterium]|nr:hypothetical protein [Deltaproteobacteria bacterium]
MGLYLRKMTLVAICSGLILAPLSSAEATNWRNAKNLRVAKRPQKNARISGVLSQENRHFLQEIKLDKQIAKSLGFHILATRRSSQKRALIEIFDSGLSTLRGMYKEARAISTLEAVKIEATRLAAITDTLLVSSSLRFRKPGKDISGVTVSSPKVKQMNLTVAKNDKANWVETRLGGKESYMAHRNHFIIRPYPGEMRELWEDTRNIDPLATRPIDRISMQRHTYSRPGKDGKPTWQKIEFTQITRDEKGRGWVSGIRETGDSWHYGPVQSGWKVFYEGPTKMGETPSR